MARYPTEHLPAGLDSFERYTVCLIAFVLPTLNGRPYVLSSGFVCMFIVLLLMIRGMQSNATVPARARLVGYAFGAWVFAAALSTAANLEMRSILNFLWGYVLPLMLFLCLVKLKLDTEDYQWIAASLAAGFALRFGYGALVFYSEWGIPSLSELLSAHYDLRRMDTYMEVTFGSTGNSASLVAVALPVLVLCMICIPMKKQARAAVIAGVAVTAVTGLITGSRATLLIVAAVLALSAFRLKGRLRYPLLVVLLLSVYLFTVNADRQIMGALEAVVAVDAVGDNSIAERIDSITYGFGMMLDNPLGVGPGMSMHYNPYGVPHQFAVAQGSDLGFLGMLTSLLFAGVVIAGLFAPTSGPQSQTTAALPFRYGAFTWMLYTMTANMTVNSGPNMPWVGVLALCLALGHAESDSSFAVSSPAGGKRFRAGDADRGLAPPR